MNHVSPSRTRRTRPFLALLSALWGLLAAFPAAAATPGGEWYVGAGLSWSAPLNGSVPEQRQTLAVSLELSHEWERAVAGLTLIHGANFSLDNGDPKSWGTPWDAIALHAAWIPWSSPWASLYVGGGPALLFVGFRRTDGDFPNQPFFHWDTGPAVMAEAGLLFLRDQQWGRVSLGAQLFVPAFTVTPDSAPGAHRISLFTLGIRAQL